MRISLLGPPELTWDGHPLHLPRRESRALLYRLAAHAPPVPREELAFLFWAEAPEATARRNLSYLLANLRRALPWPHLLCTTDDGVVLNWPSVSSDAVSFLEYCSVASAREHAVQLVRGQFLAGLSLPGHPEFEAWVAAERSALERLFLQALAALVDEHTAAGHYASAMAYARRYLATDELAEEMYRRLIALHALNGERSAALREFERCAVVLERELHLDPSAETRAAYQAVLDGRPAAELLASMGIKATAHGALQLEGRPNHNLPAPLSNFVGREREMADLRRLIHPSQEQARLVTLTGAGGSGKTRLALEVARRLLDQYPDGVWWVDLAPLADPMLVPQAVASALGFREQVGRPLVETVQDHLRLRRLLLLLDNCEHLLEACGEFAASLLSSCPDLRILATSREAPLGVAGETDYLVPGLSLPVIQSPLSLAHIEDSEAVRLFVARATAVRRDFALTEESAGSVCRICIGLDGLPLALELAVARLNVLTVHELDSRLHDRFHLLIGGSRGPLPRHQTLRAAIDWSYQLLSESERALLRRVSVFAGGFTREAAEAVCTDEHTSPPPPSQGGKGEREINLSNVLDLLTHLVAKSLVVMQPEDEHARYRLLETIRQYAWERLQEAGEATAVQERHARYFVDVSEGINLVTDPRLDGLRVEMGNLRTALTWVYRAATREPAPAYGKLLLRLMIPFAEFCRRTGATSEGREWAARVLESSAGPQRILARASLLRLTGYLYSNSDFARARSYYEESASIFRELGDKRGLAIALANLSSQVRIHEGLAAYPLAEEALALARELQDKEALLPILYQVGQATYSSADDSRCRVIWEEYLATARELNDSRGKALGLIQLAIRADYWEGQRSVARTHLEEGIAVLDQLDDKFSASAARTYLAQCAMLEGDLGRARQIAADSAERSGKIGQSAYVAICLVIQAVTACHQGEVERAIRWGEAAFALARELAAHGDKNTFAAALGAQGRALTLSDPRRAHSLLSESLALFRALRIETFQICVLYFLGWVRLLQGDPEVAASANELGASSEERKVPQGAGWARLLQGEWARQRGEHWEAADRFDRAAQVFRDIGAHGDLAIVLHKQGLLAEARDDPARAAELWSESLVLARPLEHWAVMSANLRSLAGLALDLGRPEWGAQLIGAADTMNVELVWSLRFEVEHYERDRTAIRERLGEKAFAAATEDGQRMQAEQVEALAQRMVRLASRLAPTAKEGTSAEPRRSAVPLSARERQVLALAAQELTDAQIAEQLVISPRTVTTHLTSIYRKLAVNSRAEAVRAASDLALSSTTD